LNQQYFLMQLTTIDGQLYYYPRKFETRILVYLKSKVKDAVFSWGIMREEIDSVLKLHNGYGLPAD